MARTDMASYWDERARENAAFFVDSRLPYRGTDLEPFWAGGPADLDRLLGATGARLAAADAVVEIGCGLGRLTRVIAGRAATVAALDVSGEMLARAREHNSALENVTWIHGDGVSLAGVPDANADAVISDIVFQHIPDPAITLGYVREIGRVLRAGGWAAFQISNDPGIHRRRFDRDQWRTRVGALLGRRPKGQQHPAWRGSAVDLADLRVAAAEAGMELAAVSGEGTQLCYVRLEKRA